MSLKILIVEDQFIEANDLKLILEGAGHEVCGIAKSYDHALLHIEQVRPHIVLLDIFLKGKLTGLDLAVLLSKENIPFIYLSANSNQAVLEEAKLTRPYGFLVKPFRERDVLVALDIAEYKHRHQAALFNKQEGLLMTILASILGEQSGTREKLVKLARAFKTFIPFDFIFIDTDADSSDNNSLFSLKRIGFDEYETHDCRKVELEFQLDQNEYRQWRSVNSSHQQIILENSEELELSCKKDAFLNMLIERSGAKSRIIVPLIAESGYRMSIRFYSKESDMYTLDHRELLLPIRSLLAMVIDNIGHSGLLINNNSNDETHRFATKIPNINSIIGNSPKLLRALDQAVQVANFDMTVLILGETGVGKEGLVQAIHQLSGRAKRPLVKINCAAIPAMLIESELFGHEKGSFTGAYERRLGKFEQAQGGTIFLDEIGELPLEVQTKLLRVLQEKELERIGGRVTIKIDVRVIAATNRNLQKDVIDGRFRMDLFYRLNVFPILLSPLRERKEDIPLLTTYFLEQHAALSGSEPKKLTTAVMQRLMNYSWPGNIRELQHTIERNVVLSPSNVISRIDLPEDVIALEAPEDLQQGNFRTIEEVDRDHIIAALKKCNGRVSGKGGAAEILNLPATTLNSKMKKLGIAWKYIY
ncbi:sigma 54-interacting response regulator [Mucilaginibacter sp. cycad4]|uniref:sigma 54-interacting response regulator n=1 Tax=Mucilaginibacter sp. cycad4 TaxID=3342096 RepID=UPI002AAAD835|nr:sigma 54-interacting response regulator [Mucilaginibacter gossypii]WPU99134.1 sigma 54-interacting response regulator [Mucilaginibacter gossypii]